MGMITEYVRLPPDEMARVLDDPDGAWERVEELVEDGERHHDTDKAWDAIGFVLRRSGFPVDVVEGGQTIEAADDDWEYGPPRHLDPSEVRRAADGFAATDIDALVGAVDPAELTAAKIYPQIWDEPDALDYVREHLHTLVAFLAAAARDGDAVLVWLG